MSSTPRFARLPFFVLVGLCLLQLTWWVYFQLREAGRVERSEIARLDAVCYRAACEVVPATRSSETPLQNLERELGLRFVELELATEAGKRAQGCRLDKVFAGLPQELAGVWVRPRETALAEILDRAGSRRRMYAAEGATFAIVVLLGVVVLYGALKRELLVRRVHESFLTGATHEMKTPLASIRLGLQTLMRPGTSPELAERYSERMIFEVDRLRMQLDNLLLEAHGDGARFRLAIGDLGDDVGVVVSEFEPRFQERGVQLAYSNEGSAMIERDADAVRQVLRNLLDNALKYAPEGSTASVRLHSDERHAIVTVRDEGPGVSPEDADHIFDRFHRGGTQGDSAKGGTGLGLYIARTMAKAHNGELALVATASGACFELRLPLAKPEEAA